MKHIKNAAVTLAIGATTLGVVKECENLENEQINKEFIAEHPDADTIFADAANTCFYAQKKADYEKIDECEKQINLLKNSLLKLQQKDDEAFLNACKTGKKEDVEKLVKTANLNAVDKDGNNGLMLALQNENIASSYAISQFLLKQSGLNVSIENKKGVSAIDLVGVRMVENSMWSPIKKMVQEAQKQNGYYTYYEEKPFLSGSSKKKSLVNKINFYIKEMKEVYSYTIDVKKGTAITEGRTVDCEDIDVQEGMYVGLYAKPSGTVKEWLKDNSKKRKKGEKVESCFLVGKEEINNI